MINRFALILAVGVLLHLFANSSQAQEPKNSTRKIRVNPSQLTRKIGTAVNWEKDFDAALAKSKETGKPIFWYVPTLPGTFMDRKVEIDRYMMAGPFSWPNLIDAINENFVPIRSVPSREQQKQFELLPYKFVEPGFLIIQSDEEVTARVDRITTFSPQWFRTLLTENGVSVPRPKTFRQMQDWWAKFRSGDYQVEIPKPDKSVHHAVEQMLLAGMFKFRQGKHAEARQLWTEASSIRPSHPLAWKAAAEAEGVGPFARGFEIHRTLPRAAYQAGIKSAGSAAPEGLYNESQLRKMSVEFLLRMQREDGAWVDSDYDFGGTDSLPNVHVAVTSLCGMALMSARNQLPEMREQLDDAIQRATQFVIDDKNINRVDRDEILWAYAYKTRFLARRFADGNPSLKTELQDAVDELQNVQSRRGHWYHEYNNSWVTATALCALFEAQQQGATIDSEIVHKGCKALANDRFQNGAYGYYPRRKTGDAPKGDQRSEEAAAGRMPPCDLGLWYWKELGDDELTHAISVSLKHHDQLAVALKYDNHTSTHAYGGFFFWYDMRARSEAISQIKDEKVRQEFFAQQKRLVLNLPEFDGCFVDSHELGRCYGTAMALLCLARDPE